MHLVTLFLEHYLPTQVPFEFWFITQDFHKRVMFQEGNNICTASKHWSNLATKTPKYFENPYAYVHSICLRSSSVFITDDFGFFSKK